MAGRRRLAPCSFLCGEGPGLHCGGPTGKIWERFTARHSWGQNRAGYVWKAVGLLPQDPAQSETLARLPPVPEGRVSPEGK